MKNNASLIAAALCIIVLLLSIYVDWIGDVVHAIVLEFFGGLSIGKTITVLAGIALLALMRHFSRPKPSWKRFEKPLFFLITFFAIAGFAYGWIEFNHFSTLHASTGPFSTMIQESNYVNWESSGIKHNHFPKMTLFWLESLLGVHPGNNFDDGYPLYSIYPDASWWAGGLAVIFLLFLLCGIAYWAIASKEWGKLELASYALALFGLSISMIDGGVGSFAAMTAMFFYAMFFTLRFVPKSSDLISSALPLLFASFLAFLPLGLVFIPAQTASYSIQPVILFGVLYFFWNRGSVGAPRTALLLFLVWLVLESTLAPVEILSLVVAALFCWQLLRKEVKLFERLLGVALVFMALMAFHTVQFDVSHFANGWKLGELSTDGSSSIIVYGLPVQSNPATVRGVIEQFGSVQEFDQSGWAAYARVIPKNPGVTSRRIEKALQKELRPSGYLYVDASKPNAQAYAYVVEFEDAQDLNQWIRPEFLGNRVLSIEREPPNQSRVVLYSDEQHWLGLALLSEIRANGYGGKLLVYTFER